MSFSIENKYNNLVATLLQKNPDVDVFKKKDIIEAGVKCGYPEWDITRFFKPERRVSHGHYSMTQEVLQFRETYHQDQDNSSVVTPASNPINEKEETSTNALSEKSSFKTLEEFDEHQVYIPKKDKDFVPFGNYSIIKKILKSNQFFPVYISGMSGNGKTKFIKQVCAELKREFIRVQINPDTDESDLFGGLRLHNGSTSWQDGPITIAAKKGAVVLLDEIDRTSNRILALNGVLEGDPFLLKKTGELVTPKPGFQIFATANTKGRGSDDGRYTSAFIIDEAVLERFPISLEHEFPTKVQINKIFEKFIKNHYCTDSVSDKENMDAFVDLLTGWSEIINKSFKEDAIDENISVRRLIHIIRTYLIMGGNPIKSIQMCINRFDETTQEAFLDIFKKMDKNNISWNDDDNNEDDNGTTLWSTKPV
jgi:hypothetical protein